MNVLHGLVPFLLVLACSSPAGFGAAEGVEGVEGVEDLELALGEEVYLDNCARCHGVTGRGDGPEGRALQPPPRDLVAGRFEYKTTPGREPPSDDDFERILVRGILDEGMPSFALLAPDERHAVIRYIRALASAASG